MNKKKEETLTSDEPNLMPFNDPVYVDYMDKLQKMFPLATFMTSMPYGAPTNFDGGKYSFLVNVPVIVNIQRQTGNFKTTIVNRIILANIIDPPKYDEILDYKKHEDIEHLQYWKTEVAQKNPNYSKLQEYCQNKNIILFETLYIDKIQNRIRDLHALTFS